MTHKANTIEDLYQVHCNTWSDIQHHLGILRYFASKCAVVLELGMRTGVSTCALLSGGPVVHSIDLERNDEAVKQLAWLCPNMFVFHQGSSLQDWPIEADLILFDTVHTYAHLKKELQFNAHNARRYMIFHDTWTFRWDGEDGTKPGLLDAISPYYEGPSPTWKKILDLDNCCGLMVLERCS